MILKSLNSVAQVIAGQSPASSTYNTVGEGLPFFQGKADFQEMYPTVRMWCTSAKRKVAEPGDILISVRAPVGAVNVCNQKSIIGRGLSAIRPSGSLDGMFLYYFLKANENRIAALGSGSTFKAITQSTLKNIEIPLPPLEDQKRIVNLLSKVEGLIVQRKQHLQQLDELLKSIFWEMFGDPVRNERNHKVSTLEPYITHLTSGGRGWAKYYSSSGKRFIRSLDVQMNVIGTEEVVYVTPPANKEAERTKVLPGDVLLTITGSKIGRACFVPRDFEEAYISQHVAIIRAVGINPVYLSFYLSMPNCGQLIIERQQYGQAKPGLNLTQIKNFAIIDADITLQKQFASIFEKVGSIKSRYQQSLTDLENLYGALSQKAFKGELDLARVQLPDELVPELPEVTEKVSLEPPVERSVEEFKLPEPAEDWMYSAESRNTQLGAWVDAYIVQMESGSTLSLDAFWDLVQGQVFDFIGEGAPDISVEEYDQVKGWLFKAIESGRVEQVRKSIKMMDGTLEPGNQVILKKV